jgi:hypothetical protein
MAFTTFAAFVAGLTGLTVSGVRRKYGAPPDQPLKTAELPALYPSLPTGQGVLATLAGNVELTNVVCDLNIAIQPTTQRTNAVNFAAALTMMDALNDALETQTLALGLDSWSLRVEEVWYEGAESGMWLVVATVRASG